VKQSEASDQSGGREWSGNWTRLIGQNVRAVRKRRKLSTLKLSELCTERVGFAVPRNTIVNLETGRKESLSVQELVALALALEPPPVMLLYPLDQDVEIAPGVARSPLHAIEWFAGRWNADTPSELTDSDRLVALELRDFRSYVEFSLHAHKWTAAIDSVAGADDARAVELRRGYQDRLAEALEQMSKHRDDLQRQGIEVPELPWLDHVAEAKPLTRERTEA
jgi:transcriptional regulator with XRE-family HTH domain